MGMFYDYEISGYYVQYCKSKEDTGFYYEEHFATEEEFIKFLRSIKDIYYIRFAHKIYYFADWSALND